MRDGPLRSALKATVRLFWTLELGARRRLPLVRERPRWELGGQCQQCAKCCETPSIQAGPLTFHLGPLRRLFLGWQRLVNGFELLHADRDSLSFAFRCTHFDTETRRCDSYHSRPTMCRDYPVALLDQAWPELFDGCGYRILATDRDHQLAVLEDQGLPPDKLAELRRRLRLE